MRNILRQIIVVFATGALLLLVSMEGALGSEVMGSAADFRVNDAQPRTAYFANTAQREAAALLGFKIPDALASGGNGDSLWNRDTHPSTRPASDWHRAYRVYA